MVLCSPTHGTQIMVACICEPSLMSSSGIHHAFYAAHMAICFRRHLECTLHWFLLNSVMCWTLSPTELEAFPGQTPYLKAYTWSVLYLIDMKYLKLICDFFKHNIPIWEKYIKCLILFNITANRISFFCEKGKHIRLHLSESGNDSEKQADQEMNKENWLSLS